MKLSFLLAGSGEEFSLLPLCSCKTKRSDKEFAIFASLLSIVDGFQLAWKQGCRVERQLCCANEQLYTVVYDIFYVRNYLVSRGLCFMEN